MNQQIPTDQGGAGQAPQPPQPNPQGQQAQGGFGAQGGQQGGAQPAGGQPPVAQPAAPAPVAPVPPVAAPQPPAAQPVGQQPAVQTPPQPPKPVDPNARTGQLGKRDGHIFVIPPHPNTQFDEENFLTLLEGSISLTMEEKQRVIDAIPRLSIEQINELISIFTEEKQKFAELESEFADDVAKLKQEREKEIAITEMKQEEAGAEEDDLAAAEALKKQMGL